MLLKILTNASKWSRKMWLMGWLVFYFLYVFPWGSWYYVKLLASFHIRNRMEGSLRTLISWVLIFTFCPKYFQAQSVTVLLVTIFCMFIRVLLAEKRFITKFTHHSFQKVLSCLSFCQLYDKFSKSFLPSCIFILCCFRVILDLKLCGIEHILHIYSV